MNIIKTFGVLSALIASTATVSAQTLMEPLRKDFTLSKREGKDQNEIFKCLVKGIMEQEITPQDSTISEENSFSLLAVMNHNFREVLEQNHHNTNTIKALTMEIEKNKPIQRQAQDALIQKNRIIAQQTYIIEQTKQALEEKEQLIAKLQARIAELERNQQ